MKIITTLLLFISISTFAQSKTGTVDIDYIVTKMPAFLNIQSAIEVYGKDLDTNFNKKLDEYKKQIDLYEAEEASLTEAEKTLKQQAIIALEDDISKFKNNGVKLIQIKRDELLRPLYQEIGVALETTAKAQGYTLIMQTNDSMVYIDPKTDVTRSVLTQLGIIVKK